MTWILLGCAVAAWSWIVVSAHRVFVRRYVDHDLRARARRELEERRQ